MSSIRQRLKTTIQPVQGSTSMDPFRRLRKLDIYRKVPKDLTEGSAVGGFVTTVSVLILLMLTFAELRALAQVSLQTDLVVDTSEDAAFRINLNVTVMGLSCEFLSVDLKNALGTKREDLNDNTLHKFTTDDLSRWKGSATRKLPAAEVHTYDIPDGSKDHYGNVRHAIELDKTAFEKALDEHEVLLVDFHSPRCIHCVKFAPIYEAAAGLVKERSPGRGVRQDSHKKFSVALATVDCIQNLELCRSQHIQAYPTVHVYRSGYLKQQIANSVNGNYFEPNKDHKYEVYLGAREMETIANFALKVLDEVLTQDPSLGPQAFKDTTESAIQSKGCRVQGYLDVRRVPGSVIIRPHSRHDSHDFDTGLLNVDHRIDHLSFGNRLVRESSEGAYVEQTANPLVLKDAAFVGFKGREPSFSHIHFIKVVSRTIVPLGKQPVQTYEYSIASDSFRPDNNIPTIEISFDLSPLQIRVTETRRNWAEGITAMLALIGGVFSASFIVESILSSFASWVVDTKNA